MTGLEPATSCSQSKYTAYCATSMLCTSIENRTQILGLVNLLRIELFRLFIFILRKDCIVIKNATFFTFYSFVQDLNESDSQYHSTVRRPMLYPLSYGCLFYTETLLFLVYSCKGSAFSISLQTFILNFC